ncbi:MAG: serine hydrolase domain-containing protein [Tissierellia bacterium]|nr:serine hydrolase domain-containing protein [Tissierellia bacterium]
MGCFGGKVQAQGELPSGLSRGEIARTVEDYVAEHRETMAGLSLAIFEGDEVLYEGHFGHQDLEAGTEVDGETVYEWGSTSKLFIWISVMQLVEAGKLDLSEDIRAYLPEDFLQNLSYDLPITLLDLMNHQGGFQETYFIQTPHREEILPLGEALSFHPPRQIFPPGVVTAYSNWGAALAAYIVQEVSGMDYVRYVHRHILEPLGMEKTSVGADYGDSPGVLEKRLALQCYDGEGEKIPGRGLYYIQLYPAGSAVGPLEDFLTFARALIPREGEAGPLFQRAETWELLYSPSSFYGDSGVGNSHHGFFASQYGVTTLGHGGNTFGCSSMIQFEPETGLGMVVLTNQAHEQVYNYDFYEEIFGSFSDSTLADLAREVPGGLVISARTIQEGPLSILGTTGILSFGEEDLDSWWYGEGKHIYGGYTDYRVDSLRSVKNLLAALVIPLGGIYGIITLLVGGLLLGLIRGEGEVRPLRKWNYTVSLLLGLTFANLAVLIGRIHLGNTTGDIGPVESYMAQSGLMGLLGLGLLSSLLWGLKYLRWNPYREGRGETFKYICTTILALLTLAVMIHFDLYQFWAL